QSGIMEKLEIKPVSRSILSTATFKKDHHEQQQQQNRSISVNICKDSIIRNASQYSTNSATFPTDLPKISIFNKFAVAPIDRNSSLITAGVTSSSPSRSTSVSTAFFPHQTLLRTAIAINPNISCNDEMVVTKYGVKKISSGSLLLDHLGMELLQQQRQQSISSFQNLKEEELEDYTANSRCPSLCEKLPVLVTKDMIEEIQRDESVLNLLASLDEENNLQKKQFPTNTNDNEFLDHQCRQFSAQQQQLKSTSFSNNTRNAKRISVTPLTKQPKNINFQNKNINNDFGASGAEQITSLKSQSKQDQRKSAARSPPTRNRSTQKQQQEQIAAALEIHGAALKTARTAITNSLQTLNNNGISTFTTSLSKIPSEIKATSSFDAISAITSTENDHNNKEPPPPRKFSPNVITKPPPTHQLSSSTNNNSTIHSESLIGVHASLIIAIRQLAKNASRRVAARRMWAWAIAKVLRMVQTTLAIQKMQQNTLMSFVQNKDKATSDSNSNCWMENNRNHNNFRKTINNESNSNGTSKATSQNSIGSVNSRVLASLMKPPSSRTPQDIRVLEVLTKNMPGFSKYNVTVRKELARVVGYSRFDMNRTIIKEGHVAHNFYCILSGQVEVWKKVAAGSNDETGTTGMKFLDRMGVGATFGQVALVSENELRSATIITSIETEFLWLTRDDFEIVLKRETKRELDERRKYISQNPILGKLGSDAINNLAASAQTVEAAPDSVLVSEGEYLNQVLLIEGDCQLSKCVDFSKVQVRDHPTPQHNLHPFPLPRTITTPYHGPHEKTPRLVRIARYPDSELYGAAGILASVGTPNQIATLSTLLLDVNAAAKSLYSVTALTRVKYIAVNKHSFSKELIHFPQVLYEVVMRYIALKKIFCDTPKTQRLYLERNEWLRYKKRVMREFGFTV
ncbi:Cyclic nucleotide-binding domain-containing protein 2, partial [Physocladia obscura]